MPRSDRIWQSSLSIVPEKFRENKLLIYTNKTGRDMVGSGFEEFIKYGHEYFDKKYMYPSDFDFIYNGSVPTKFPHLCKIRVNFKSLGHVWINNISSQIAFEGKKYWIGANININKEKQKELYEEIHHQIIDDLSNDLQIITWMIKITKENKLTLYYVSDNFEKITGYSKSDFMNIVNVAEPYNGNYYREDCEKEKQVFDFIHPDYHKIINKTVTMNKVPTKFRFKVITSEQKIIKLETTVRRKEAVGLCSVYYGKAKFFDH